MPATAAYLVRRTRELIQLIEGSNKSYRDGFAVDSDLDPDLIPILPSVNDFLNFCYIAGAKQVDRGVTVVPGQRDYPTDEDVADVKQVYFNGVPLLETTRASLDRTDPTWLFPPLPGDPDPTPRRWFQEGGVIVLDKVPSSGIMTWRVALVGDRFDGSDPLAILDPIFGSSQYIRIPYGAALLMINIDAEVEAHQRRIAQYKSIADALIAEISGDDSDQDYSTRISLDQYVPEPQRPRGMALPSAGGGPQ